MSSIPVPVAPIYGALYLSSVMCTAFYGVACMQTFFYFIHYQNDPLRTKIFVAVLWAASTLHEGMTVSGTYKYIVGGLEDPASFAIAIPELITQLVLTVPVALPAQGFFVYRIYIFSDESLVAPLIWLPLAMYQFVASFIYVVHALYIKNGSVHAVLLSTLGDKFFTAVSVSYCGVAACVDVSIAIFLTYLLARRRVTVAFKSTARILERLTVFAVNSGIWTAIFSVLTAILVYVLSANLIYAVFFIPLCSIYCNTVLANLNGRIYIRDDKGDSNVELNIPTTAADSDINIRSRKPSVGSRMVSSSDQESPGALQGIWKTTQVVTFSDPHPSESRRSIRTQANEEQKGTEGDV